MTVKDVKKLDDDDTRARITEKAKAGDDRAATLLFFWAQWNRIAHRKDITPKQRVLLLSHLMEWISKETTLTFTYG